MSAAHLFPVPDPDDEPPPREEPAPEPATDDTEDQQPPGDAGEGCHRAFSMPDLSPYYDVRPLKELGPLAVAVGRRSGPPLRRATARAGQTLAAVTLCLARGLRLLLALAIAWLSGAGRGGSIPARLGIAAAVTYGVVVTLSHHPAARYLVPAAGLVLLAAAGTGRIPEPGTKKGKRHTASRAGALGRFTRRTSGKEKPSVTAPVDAPGEAPATPPADAPGGASAGAPDDAGDGGASDTQQPPAEPPLTALIRREIGAENGVHLADLRPAMRAALPGLSTATDEELRQVLVEAGWDPSRKFRARGRAGRAGVHRSQLPQPLSPGATPGGGETHSPPPGDRPRPANSPRPESSGEGAERGYRIVEDPQRGPAAWKIHHDGG